jgi:hypothetical protein
MMLLAGALLTPPASATMYRCPAPHGEGTVVTNLVRESDANERDCEALHARRSTIDEAPRSAQRRERLGDREQSNRFSDEWMAAPARPRPPASNVAVKGLPSITQSTAPQPTATPLRSVEPGGPESEKRVSKRVQQERDTDSRKIIQTELSKSLGMVDELRKRVEVLVAGTPEHQRLQASLTRHSVDVDSLKNELARMR